VGGRWFREVIQRYPEAGGQITDCLSGDVNKDFTQLWSWIREFVPLPDDLPYGEPLTTSPAEANADNAASPASSALAARK
jgi:hypothetical protein